MFVEHDPKIRPTTNFSGLALPRVRRWSSLILLWRRRLRRERQRRRAEMGDVSRKKYCNIRKWIMFCFIFQYFLCSTLSSLPMLPAGVRAPSAGESNFHEYLRPQPLNYFSKPCLNLSSIFLDMCMLWSLCSVIFFSGGTGSTNRNGTCYTVNECSSRGGTSSGSCAAGWVYSD